jgi:cyclopropane fatty-acyl-phospholipid synthase-like methyltransferase
VIELKKFLLSEYDVLHMLDTLLQDESTFDWNSFYSNRKKKIPFFVDAPDENLVQYFEKGFFQQGKVLELGSGPGRNAIYFAKMGCEVDAVDLSNEALKWGRERADKHKVFINFMNQNIFDLQVDSHEYDIVYDSGCFHHIAPHRRSSYLRLVDKALKKNGYFALTSFLPGGELGGSTLSDQEIYKVRSLRGGLGYSEEDLRAIFANYEAIEIREMHDVKEDTSRFGVKGLLTSLFRKTEK